MVEGDAEVEVVAMPSAEDAEARAGDAVASAFDLVLTTPRFPLRDADEEEQEEEEVLLVVRPAEEGHRRMGARGTGDRVVIVRCCADYIERDEVARALPTGEK